MNLNNFNLDNMEVLILPIICVVVFTILVLLPLSSVYRRNRMHQQKAMQIIKYLTQERPQMLAQAFPYWQLSELQDYTQKKKKRKILSDYNFQMKMLFQNQYVFELKNYIKTSEIQAERGSGNSSITVYASYLTISVNPILQLQNHLPGSFVTTSNSLSIMRGVEAIAGLIAKLKNDSSRMNAYYQAKTSDEIKLNSSGQICYGNIPRPIWDKFAANALLQIDNILILWKTIAPVSLCYAENKSLYLKITVKSNQREPYQCLEEDFILDNSERIQQSVLMLAAIADLVYNAKI